MVVNKEIQNWDELPNFLQSLPLVDIACRGQGKGYFDVDQRHVLKARIDRSLALIKPEDRYRTERAVCQRFREHAPIYLSDIEAKYLESPWLQLVVMQHYGAPTRLLDWTKSAWVATYFAVSSDWESDGYLYGFKRNRLDEEIRKRYSTEVNGLAFGLPQHPEHLPDPEWDSAAGNTILFYEETIKQSKWVATYYCRKAHFPRLVAQQGLFTFGSMLDLNHWEHICNLLNNKDCWIVRIPAKLKPLILRWLNTIGLNGATLFPGADGIGKSMECFIRAWPLDPKPIGF